MDIQTLTAFRAVAETGSFSNAAEKLFLTQPAISKRIASLEKELETKLLDRIGRLTVPTHAGKLLLPRAIRILDEIEESRRLISNLSGSVAGKLTLATSHHIGLHRLPPVLQTFSKRHPDVHLELRFMDSESACREVESGEIELAIVTLPAAPPPTLRTVEIWNDPLSFVIGNDSANNAGSINSLEALSKTGAILPSINTVTRKLIEEAFSSAGLSFSIAMETNYLETIKKMVEIGLGWSALPTAMLDGQLIQLDIPGIKITRSLGIVTHSKRTQTNACTAMSQLLVETESKPNQTTW